MSQPSEIKIQFQQLWKCQQDQLRSLKEFNSNNNNSFISYIFPQGLQIQENIDGTYSLFFNEQTQSQYDQNNSDVIQQLKLKSLMFILEQITITMQKLAKLKIFLVLFDLKTSLHNLGVSIEQIDCEIDYYDRNILNNLPQFILTDFNLTINLVQLRENEKPSTMDPELINMIKNNKNQDDIQFQESMIVYTLGQLLYQIQIHDFNKYYNETEQIAVEIPQNIFNIIQKATNSDPQKRISLDELFYYINCFRDQSFNQLLTIQLKLQIDHQKTGRLYLMQNIAKLKYIQKLIEYFTDFLPLQQLLNYQIDKIVNEVEQLKQYLKLNKNQNPFNKIPLDYYDTKDEQKQFIKYYKDKFLILLQRWKVDNIQSINWLQSESIQQFKQNIESNQQWKQQLQIQKEKHLNILDKIDTIFLHDNLITEFPFIKYNNENTVYQEYDQVFQELFPNTQGITYE